MDLHFRPPLWAYVFFPLWYLVLALFVAGLVANGWAPETTAGDEATAIGIIAMLVIGPLGFQAFANRRSKDELGELLNFLAEHVDAR